jgi:hypothetical protein
MAENAKQKIDERPGVEQLFKQVLEEAGISDPMLAKIALEGLSAVETKFAQKDGVFHDERSTIAWSERREMLELICKLKGHLVEKHEHSGKLTLEQLLDESHGCDPQLKP